MNLGQGLFHLVEDVDIIHLLNPSLGCAWAAVHVIAGPVVAELIYTDRLNGPYRIGVDEISYRRGHHYLTVVADRDAAKVVRDAKGKEEAPLTGSFDALGPERSGQIEAISMDLGPIYRDAAPDVPFSRMASAVAVHTKGSGSPENNRRLTARRHT